MTETIRLPEIPFTFFGPDGQMKVVIDHTEDAIAAADPDNPGRPKYGSYRGYIVNCLAKGGPEKIMPIGLIHCTALAAEKALIAGVKIDREEFPDPADEKRRALDALVRARRVKKI